MNSKISVNLLIFICFNFIIAPLAWSRSIISGQVVDAEAGEPIKKAAVHIYWGVTKGIPGLSYGKQVEVGEDLTDNQGRFKIPKYSTLLKHYYMAVYKKGYVCWSSRKIFPTYEERKSFKLKNGIVIKLERFKEEYSKEKHANFTISSEVGSGSKHIFDNATKSEQKLLYRIAQERSAIEKAQFRTLLKEEKTFIDCMRRMEKGKYHINEFCNGIWSTRFKKYVRGSVSAPYSDIYKAMVEFGIIIEYEEESDLPNIYIIKK